MNESIFYGQQGQPVGSIEEDALFDKTGVQIGYLSEDHIYKMRSGERIGSVAGGVIYNAFGAPQAFAENCRKSLMTIEPRLSPLPPRLSSTGPDLSKLPSRPIPDFLREDSLANGRDGLRDGLFQ